MEMSYHKIGSIDAEEIAMRFLQQHHSVRGVESAICEDDSWKITVMVSSPRMKKITVRIDARTGLVLGWE